MKKSEKTKQFIIERAALLFNARGIAGTTIDDILAATHLTKGCIYRHFTNKDELANESVDYLMKKLKLHFAYLVGSHKNSFGKLCALIDMYKYPSDSFLQGGCPMLNFSVEADDTNPDVMVKVKNIIIEWQELYIGIIEEGIRKNEFNTSMNPKGFAIKTFAMLQGGFQLSRSLNESKPLYEINKMLKKDLESFVIG